jgi:PiT family inorganic phosphate transporter
VTVGLGLRADLLDDEQRGAQRNMGAYIFVVIALGLFFDFLNGTNDSSNIVATMISSKAFRPRVAMAVTAAAQFSSPFIFGVAVATTIGRDVVEASDISLHVIVATLVSAILWNRITYYLAIPSSSSHALIGGFVGAVVAAAGWQAVLVAGLRKVLLTLFISPLLGFAFGYLALKVIFALARNSSPRINQFFKRSQAVTTVALALSYGANDAQKTMGIVTLALVINGNLAAFKVPVWVIIAYGGMISLGTVVGGWRLIRTLGAKFYRIRPVHGVASQVASASVIFGAALVGGPVSTTQVVGATIMGVGAGERPSQVRWGVGQEMAVAWLLTIPASALFAAGLYWLIGGLVPG